MFWTCKSKNLLCALALIAALGYGAFVIVTDTSVRTLSDLRAAIRDARQPEPHEIARGGPYHKA